MGKEKMQCYECEMSLQGRSDKKFCNDHCRNAWNNSRNSDSNNFMRNVNNILRKNRRILFEFIELKRTQTNKQELVLKGFNFNYFTHYTELDDGETKYLFYEAGLIYQINNQVEIFKLNLN